MIYLYDDALLEKIKAVFPNVRNLIQEKWYEASDSQANITVPLITFYRMSNRLSETGYNFHDTVRRGRAISIDRDNYSFMGLKSVPISLEYQIDIYSDKRSEVDQIFKEVIMFLLEEPEIKIVYKDLEFQVTCRILENDHTSDVSSFTSTGKLYRETITIEFEQAYMLYSREGRLVKDIGLRVVPLPKGDLDTLIKEYEEDN